MSNVFGESLGNRSSGRKNTAGTRRVYLLRSMETKIGLVNCQPGKHEIHMNAYLAEEKVESVVDEDLALLPELLLDLLFAGAREVGRALADPAQRQGVTLGRNLQHLRRFCSILVKFISESQVVTTCHNQSRRKLTYQLGEDPSIERLLCVFEVLLMVSKVPTVLS